MRPSRSTQPKPLWMCPAIVTSATVPAETLEIGIQFMPSPSVVS